MVPVTPEFVVPVPELAIPESALLKLRGSADGTDGYIWVGCCRLHVA